MVSFDQCTVDETYLNRERNFYIPWCLPQCITDYASQQDFGAQKVYCVSNVTFHAESKYAITIFPSPTVFVQWPI